jgi:superfamily II DNA or RNA helicase
LCPKGIVYNLEVEDHNNYFAENILVHNCHHLAAPQYQTVCKNLNKKCRTIGLSGTCWREDGIAVLIHAVAGPIVYNISIDMLRQLGYLVETDAIFIELPVDDAAEPLGNYKAEYSQLLVNNTIRNDIIAEVTRELTKTGTVIIIVKEITHALLLKDLLPEATVAVASGYMAVNSKQREQAWTDIKSGDAKVIITTLADEGLDIANLESVIIAAGGASDIKTVQRLRCMTPSAGKTKAYVIDFMDTGEFLSRHSAKRYKMLKKQGLNVRKLDYNTFIERGIN